jgi:dTDP-4-dehydrorhamnose reductase
VIINAAGWTDVDAAENNVERAYAVNKEGALNVSLAAKAVDAVFVQVSTDYVFSGNKSTAWKEDERTAPLSIYGASKAAGEKAVLEAYPQRTYVLRTAWLYGPWGRNFAKTMSRLALDGATEVRVVTDNFGQPTSAIDLSNQIIDTVIAKLPFGIYHATNGGRASWFEFAYEIFHIIGGEDYCKSLAPIESNELVRPAKRPVFSVLGHEGWKIQGIDGVSVSPMRDWRIALRANMPEIISTLKAEG